MTHHPEYSPHERAEHVAGVAPLLQGQSRRLARSGGSSVHRAATDMHPCGRCINPARLPPAPPNDGNPATWGRSGRKGGRAIAFCNAGAWRVCQKPVDGPLCNLATPRGTKPKPLTVNFHNPRVVPFCPRVTSLFPRVGFCIFASRPLSISLFSLIRESEREGCAEKRLIHGFLRCLKKHPRVWSPIHGFSGDAFLGKTQCWRGFAGVLPLFHASTGRNAYTSLGLVRND